MPCQAHQLKKQNGFKKKKKRFTLTASASFMLFTSTSFMSNLHHHHTDCRSRTILKKKEFLSCPLLPQTCSSSSGVMLSFACPNLHHTTHRITLPHRSTELCVKLVNILELPWATIQRFVFHDLPFLPVWISNYFDGFFWVYGFWLDS